LPVNRSSLMRVRISDEVVISREIDPLDFTYV